MVLWMLRLIESYLGPTCAWCQLYMMHDDLMLAGVVAGPAYREIEDDRHYDQSTSKPGTQMK
jgi:hypothetical protein